MCSETSDKPADAFLTDLSFVKGVDGGFYIPSKTSGEALRAPLTRLHIAMSVAKQSDVEYEFGNARSTDSSDGEPSLRDASQNQRIVMMYDDSGNAIPMPMGNFYYDTYKAPEDESSEEEVDDDKHASDTECAHKPAAFSMNPAEESGSEESYTDEGSQEGDGDDQFMRIQVAAVPLKSATQVKADVRHDKPMKSASSFQGMKRALSAVKPLAALDSLDKSSSRVGAAAAAKEGPGNNAQLSAKEKAAQARAMAKSNATGRSGVGAMGRMMSFNKKGGGGTASKGESLNANGSENSTASSGGLSQDRDRSKPSPANSTTSSQRGQKRQGLAAVGRMLSLRKEKKEPPKPKVELESPTISEVGSSPVDRDSPSGNDPVLTGAKTPGGANARPGIQKVGRMMSMSKRKPQDDEGLNAERENVKSQFNPDDRDRREESEKTGVAPGARMGLKQAGRMMSISKRPAGAAQGDKPATDANSGQREGTGGDRAPAGNAATAKRESRKGLQAVGRMMSFSRKPANAEKGNAKPSAPAVPESGVKATAASIRISPPSSSPRLDGRANKFFFSEINSTAIKESGILGSESHIRVPVLVMAEYSGPVSKNKWFIDAFTLPHNAFRRECIDMYDILMALARCRADADVTRDDMKDFYAWWVIAERFFKCYFDMEREVLFPWVDVAGSKDWELQMALNKMRAMKDGLQEQLEDVNRAWKDINVSPPGTVFANVYRAVDAFCPRAMNYFSDQELLLPQIVRGFYKIEDRLVMDKDMLAAFMGEPLSRKTKDLPHHNLILLVRWIANPRQLRAWIAKNLNSSGRSAYVKWHASYETEHSRLVKSFRNRSRASTIAAMTAN